MSAAALHEVQHAQLALIGSARAGRRTLLDMLLSARGYEIAVCEDGPSVLEFLKENQPAIAIFDHDLPGMDGREICSRMRFITRLADTPIAIVTPSVEEMGGAAEFESFTDTTTADIVEAEPLGKKKLVERLENVIRDQKGAAFDGKVTIAMPTMAPPIPEIESPSATAGDDGMDVFVDDDVDIEVDVARAIYSNDGSHEEREAQPLPPAPGPVAETAPQVDQPALGVESTADLAAPAEYVQVEDELLVDNDQAVDPSAETPVEEIAAAEVAPKSEETPAEFGEEMFLVDDGVSSTSGQAGDDDLDLFTADVEPGKAATEPESEWLESLTADDDFVGDAVAEAVHEDSEPEQEFEPKLVGVAASRHEAEHPAAAHDVEITTKDTLVELVTETEGSSEYDKAESSANSEPKGHGVSERDTETKATTEAIEATEATARPTEADETPSVSFDSLTATNGRNSGPEEKPAANDLDDDELTATIEAAIEAVNLAAMEEAEYLSRENPSEQAASHDEVRSQTAEQIDAESVTKDEPAELDEIDVKNTVEMVVDSAEPEAQGAEPVVETPVEAVEPHEAQAEAPVAEVEIEAAAAVEAEAVEAEAAVDSSEPQTEESPEATAHAMELATDAPPERDANNYADDREDYRVESPSAEADGQEEGEPAVLNEERSNMQALIAEQAERIDSLQERNVQLRQELEQLKADAALRHEERSNLQALIKEQTEAITNLQQRNVQLRQELEQYKAEESKRESERTFLQSHTSEQAETIAKLQQLNALLRQEVEQRKADEAPLRDFLQRLLDRDEENSAYQEAVRNEIISLTRENS